MSDRCEDPDCEYDVSNGDSYENTQLHLRSGHVEVIDPLVEFLYALMRDHVVPGEVEKLVRESVGSGIVGGCIFTNGHLARYAQDLAARLRKEFE